MRSDGSPNSTPMAAEKKPDTRIQTMMFTPGKRRHQLVAGIGPDAHEGAGAEREQARIAGEDVEADGGEREDQERDHHRLEQEAVAEEGEGIGGEDDDGEPDPVLAQREHRHVGGVAGLELAGLAVEH